MRGFGITAMSKPSFAASFRRASACATWRNSAERATSPKNKLLGGAGRPLTDEIRAAATARSAAVSEIFRPPATFRKMSRPESGTPHRASRTAVSIASLLPSQPTTLRRGEARVDGATSASISTSTGRLPPMPANTTAPVTSSRLSARNSSDGFGTSARPVSTISKTPISSVAPNLFFTPRRIRK